jgi:hypothetical protein
MVMLNEVLECLCGRLDAALQAAEAREDPWVVLSNLVEADGSPPAGLDNRVVVSLVSLQTIPGGSIPFERPGDVRWQVAAPPLYLDAYVVVAANFSGTNYRTGLAMMSRAISFFQEKPIFTRSDTPELPDDVEKLVVEFVSLDFPAAAVLLPAALRAMPFALYRLRPLAFVQAQIARAPPIRAQHPLR